MKNDSPSNEQSGLEGRKGEQSISTSVLIGVDGCGAGWIVASAHEKLDLVQVEFAGSIGEVFSRLIAGLSTLAIDVPIGLPNCEGRECDKCARQFLAVPRKSSVFPAPSRVVLDAKTHEDAVRLYRASCNKGLSVQAFGIVRKIGEVDREMRGRPNLQSQVREAHPEVTFALLSGHPNTPLASKKTSDGQTQRVHLLQQHMSLDQLIPLKAMRDQLRADAQSTRVEEDDIVDALGCLVTAHRIHVEGEKVFCSNHLQFDACGLRMEIVA